MLQVAKSVSNALNNCVNTLPGQRDVDNAIRQITDTSQALATTQVNAFHDTLEPITVCGQCVYYSLL